MIPAGTIESMAMKKYCLIIGLTAERGWTFGDNARARTGHSSYCIRGFQFSSPYFAVTERHLRSFGAVVAVDAVGSHRPEVAAPSR